MCQTSTERQLAEFPLLAIFRMGRWTVSNDVICRYLGFLRGLVDSDTLPLSVSREVLQEHASLKVIKKKITRKVLDAIKTIADEGEHGSPIPAIVPTVARQACFISNLRPQPPGSLCPRASNICQCGANTLVRFSEDCADGSDDYDAWKNCCESY